MPESGTLFLSSHPAVLPYPGARGEQSRKLVPSMKLSKAVLQFEFPSTVCECQPGGEKLEERHGKGEFPKGKGEKTGVQFKQK